MLSGRLSVIAIPTRILPINAGSEYKIDASYLSPNVNMAARLEAATKQFGVSLLLSGDFVDCLSPGVRARVSSKFEICVPHRSMFLVRVGYVSSGIRSIGGQVSSGQVSLQNYDPSHTHTRPLQVPHMTV